MRNDLPAKPGGKTKAELKPVKEIKAKPEKVAVPPPPETPGVFFVDTETTGLLPWHEVWEVALIMPNGDEHVWTLPLDNLGGADLYALQLSGWKDRWKANKTTPVDKFSKEFSDLTWGLHWAGAVPSFDEQRIRSIMTGGPYSRGYDGTGVPGWHYHLIDVETLAYGYLLRDGWDEIPLPWKSTELAEALGVERIAAHTAIGDARWARAIYRAAVERKAVDRRQATGT